MNDRAETYAPVLEDGIVWPADAIEVGRIVDAWGVKGGIKVQPFSSDPQALFCTKKWFLRPGDTPSGALPRPSAAAPVAKPAAAPKGVARLAKPRFLQVKQARDQGDVVVATAEGLEDRNAAEALKGARVFVSRGSFPTPAEGEFYWVDLIGLAVRNREGVALDRVTYWAGVGAQLSPTVARLVKQAEAKLAAPAAAAA